MLETFFDNFAPLADAPNGVQKLRELILQLAVQGKLVPQDAHDEPASVLLAKIKAEKERLIQEKKIKKSDPLRPPDIEALPYDLPYGWEWIWLDDISDIGTGTTPPTTNRDYYLNGDVPWITSSITSQEHIVAAEQSITKLAVADCRLRLYPPGTLIVALYGQGKTRGQVSHLKISATVNQACAAIVFFQTGEEIREYIRLVLKKKYEELREMAAGGAQPNLNVGKIKETLIPLPPLAEQHRIVAKVNQLMALCDELEARQQRQQSARVRLNNAALDRLLTARAPEEFTQHWQRLCDNFDLLYDTPETVSALRQAILQLAVQGKLVPQDAHDEPASVLLAKIKAEKERLIQEKKIKKSEPLPPIDAEEAPFDLPKGWEWARFAETATIASNLVHPSKYPDLPHIAPDNIEKQTGQLLQYQTVREDEVRSSNHYFYSGQIVYSKIRPNLAKATIVDFDGLCSADMYPVNAHINSGFLLKYLLSETFLSYAVKKDTRVAMPKINQEELNRIPVVVPPLAEQRRIVAKVDQLMALCDELETKLRQAQTHSAKLMTATVQHLAAA